MNNSTPIRVGNKIIGHVTRDTFVKRVSASRHFLRTPKAIALDVDSLEQAEKAGARRVLVEDMESGVKFLATIEHIKRCGFMLNRGCGVQLALPLAGWIKTAPRGVLAEQLSMWG